MTEAAQTETKTEIPNTPKPEKPKPLAKEVIEELMIMWRDKIPKILRLLIDNAVRQEKPIEALKLFNSLKEASEHALDAAHKLVPFQSPKLESVSLRNEITHKFVIRSPEPIANVNDWIEQTGAQRLNIEQHVDDRDAKPQEEETQQDDIAEDEKLTLEPETNNPDLGTTYPRRAPNIKLTRNKLIN